MRRVAEATRVPEAEIWGAGLFYTLINRPGQRIRVCDGLSCQMAGADDLAVRLAGEGKECERVSCLGQCDRAPATLDESRELVTYEGRRRGITPDDPELPMNLGGAVDGSYSALARTREQRGSAGCGPGVRSTTSKVVAAWNCSIAAPVGKSSCRRWSRA